MSVQWLTVLTFTDPLLRTNLLIINALLCWFPNYATWITELFSCFSDLNVFYFLASMSHRLLKGDTLNHSITVFHIVCLKWQLHEKYHLLKEVEQ